jgi:hypothetical protein
MPSIKANADKLQKAKEDGTVVPVSSGASASMSSAPPMPPGFPPSPSPFFSGPLPPVMSNAADQTRYFHNNAMPQARVAPNPPASQPTVGSVSESIIINSGSLTLLETNNVKNPVQGKLNLIAGSGIQLVPDQQGGVTVIGTSTGDDLIHGDSIWEIDPGFIILRDDFIGGTSTFSSPLYSELPWTLVNPGSTGNNGWISSGFPCFGSVSFINNSTAGNNAEMALGDSISYPQPYAWPVFDYPGWKMIWVFQLGKHTQGDGVWNWNKVSFYIGLGGLIPNSNVSVSNVPRLPSGCWLRYDTDTTAPSINDTQFVFECVTNVVSNASPTRSVSNVQGNTFGTGISAQENHTYRFEMTCVAAGQIQMLLVDGTAGTSASKTLTMPTWTLAGSNTHETYNTGSNFVEFDFYNSSGGFIAAPFGPGSKIGVSGIVATGYTGLNGNWIVQGGTLAGSASSIANTIWYGSSLPASGTQINGTYTGYPAMIPWFAFGNDSTASPTANTKGVAVDFFGFVWNPGVGGGTGIPNSLKPRYW